MNLYAVSVVQNEADIIRENVLWACRFFKRIWIWDLGSTDGTWEALLSLRSEQVIPSRHEGLPFTSSLKGRVFAEARPEIEDCAWVYILDADEFLVEDPRPLLQRAEAADRELVGAWQVNFFPVASDLQAVTDSGESAWTTIPIAERLRHYRVEWFEWRFIRATAELVWDTSGSHSRWTYAGARKPNPSRHSAMIRHYRYRSPSQVAARHATRRTSPAPGYGQFRYDASSRFEDFVMPEDRLHFWEDPRAPLVVPAGEMLRANIMLRIMRAQRKWRRLFGRAGQ